MALTPSYKTESVEEEYIDKGAVTTPQVNPMVEAKYRAGMAEAVEADYIEWPTDINATDEGY
jgi:hypothetical protein